MGKASTIATIAISIIGSAGISAGIAIPTTIAVMDRDAEFTITAKSNLSSDDTTTMKIEKGTKISQLKPQTKENYYFVGWFKDENCLHQYSSSDVLDKSTIVYAKYLPYEYDVALSAPESYNITFLNEHDQPFTEQELKNVKKGSTFRFKLAGEDASQETGTWWSEIFETEINYYTKISNIMPEYYHAISYNGETIDCDYNGVYEIVISDEGSIDVDGRYVILKSDFDLGFMNGGVVPTGVTILDYEEINAKENFVIPETIYDTEVHAVVDLFSTLSGKTNTTVKTLTIPKTLKGIVNSKNIFSAFDFLGETMSKMKTSTHSFIGYLTNLEDVIIDKDSDVFSWGQGILYENFNEGFIFSSQLGGYLPPCGTVIHYIKKDAKKENINIETPIFSTIVCDNAFKDCKSLKTLKAVQPETFVFIGNGAFAGSGLQHIFISSSSAFLQGNVFNSCEQLQTVYFDSVDFAGGSVFANCSNLNKITFNASISVANECENFFVGAGGTEGFNIEINVAGPGVFEELFRVSDDIAEDANLKIKSIRFLSSYNNTTAFTDSLEYYVVDKVYIDSKNALTSFLKPGAFKCNEVYIKSNLITNLEDQETFTFSYSLKLIDGSTETADITVVKGEEVEYDGVTYVRYYIPEPVTA